MFRGGVLYADNTSKLDEITIEEKILQTTGYLNQFKQETFTGSKLGLTIKETPASIEFISQKTISERGDVTVQDTLNKMTGITSTKHGGAVGGIYASRGFIANGVNVLYDGMKLSGGTTMSLRPMDNANLDRIEVIRGANSILYGEGSVGATVNLITKKPKFTKDNSVLNLSLGSLDYYRFHFSNSGVIIDDILAYQFDYSSSQLASNIESEKSKLDSVSLGLLYKINENLITTLQINRYEDDTKNPYYGTPLNNGKLDKKLRKINYNNLEDGISESKNLWIKHAMEYFPSSNIELKNQFYYYDSFRDWKDLETFTYNQDSQTVHRAWFSNYDGDHQTIGNRVDMIYKKDIFGYNNRFVIGADINKTNFKTKRNNFAGSDIVNAFSPKKKYFYEGNTLYKIDDRENEFKQYALYFENQLSVNEKLKFLGGLRYDILEGHWVYHKATKEEDKYKEKKHKDLSYRLAFIYDILDDTTFYATYTTATELGSTLFLLNQVQSQMDLTNVKQYELGLRKSFLDNSGEFTASIYKIEKKGMFVNDPYHPGNILNAGKQSSKGFELFLGIQPVKEFQIDANVSYTDSQYDDFVSGSNNFTGNIPNSIPKYVANLGFKYIPITKFSVGTWLRYVDSVYVDDANTVKLPSYTLLDVSFEYMYNKNTKFSFLIKNLMDEFYATRIAYNPTKQAMIGNPRTYEFSIRYEF